MNCVSDIFSSLDSLTKCVLAGTPTGLLIKVKSAAYCCFILFFPSKAQLTARQRLLAFAVLQPHHLACLNINATNEAKKFSYPHSPFYSRPCPALFSCKTAIIFTCVAPFFFQCCSFTHVVLCAGQAQNLRCSLQR